MSTTNAVSDPMAEIKIYSTAARTLHWLTVLLIAAQVPIGLYMTYRGYNMEYRDEAGELKRGLFDATTDMLYSTHKTIGLVVLTLVVLRLLYRLLRGAPGHEPTLATWHKVVSRLNHWAMYLLLLIVPVLGYFGIRYYPALDIFGVTLPALGPSVEGAAGLLRELGADMPAGANGEKVAEVLFGYHGIAVRVLLALVALHFTAAMYHYIVRKDKVLHRMWPGKANV